ncbi:MAG: HAD hydrolase-like protein [Nanoarchaeota archaeon]
MTKARYDAVIFDTDQTLVDSLSVMDEAFHQTIRCRYHRRARITDLPRKDYVGISIDRIIASTLRKLGFDDDVIADEIGPTKRELDHQLIGHLKNARRKNLEELAMPGVRELLLSLKEYGIHRASYTGATAAVNTALLDASGLSPLLQARSTSDDGHNRLDILLNAYAKLCKVCPSDCHELHRKNVLVVGDSPKDVEAAHDAKMKSLRITKGWYGFEQIDPLPDYTTYDLSRPQRILKTFILT